jgi:CRISPR-associated exonuclease Cas4
MITPNELRQYDYCPRVIFFERCTPVFRRETARMEQGRMAHDRESLLEHDRSLQRYGLHLGERHFAVILANQALGLSGEIDLMITVGNEAYPVEFKDTTRDINNGHLMQLCAYGLLIEAELGLTSPRGYWNSTRLRETQVVEFDNKLRKRTLKAIKEINDFVSAERFPAPTPQGGKCIDCELINFCGDVR